MIQQQVEEIVFEEVYITKSKRKAHETNKVRDWLKLLAAYDENKMYELKDKTIQQMHLRFILTQDFWLDELQRRKKEGHLNESDIQILFLGIEDGYYLGLCTKLEQLLLAELNKDQTHKNKLRVNYVIAKIQRLIDMFKDSINLFSGLRDYFISTFNTKKARELYYRQLKQAYETHDILYDEYSLWEPDQSLLVQAAALYQSAKVFYDHQCQQWAEQKRLNSLNRDKTYQEIQSSVSLSEVQKLRQLRILCLSKQKFVKEYALKFQNYYQSDEDKVMEMYKALQAIMPDIASKLYTNFLIRRINKHAISVQDEEYNNSWGAKVQQFRDQITAIIEQSTSLINKKHLYETWLEVETSLVKDKTSVCQVGQAYLQFVVNEVMLNFNISFCYERFSKCLIKLGYYADAKQVLRRGLTYQTADLKYMLKSDQNQVERLKIKIEKLQLQIIFISDKYFEFLKIYGSIKDIIEAEKFMMQTHQIIEQIRQRLTTEVVISNQNHVQSQSQSQSHNNSQSDPKQIMSANINGQIQKEQTIKEPGSSKFSQYLKNKMQKSTQIVNKQSQSQSQKQKQKIDQIRQPSKRVKLTKQDHESKPKIDLATIHLTHPEFQIIPEPSSSNTIEPLEEKQQKMYTDSGSTLFLKGFPPTSTKQQIESILKHKDKIKQIRMVQKKGQYQNYCYVDMLTPQDAQIEVDQNQNKGQYTIAISRPPAAHNQDRTLFLCGLPQTASVDKIRQLFTEEQRETIVDIRLKLDQNRNIAYVDFNNAETAKKTNEKYSHKALEMDSKKIFLKQSNSAKSLQQTKKLFRVAIIKQLAYKASEKDVIQYFKDYDIEDVFIPEDDKGKSKGFAYVKFKKDDQYKKALQIKNGYIKGRKIEIQKSDRDLHRPKNQKKERSDKGESRDTTKQKKEKDGVDNNYFSNLFK